MWRLFRRSRTESENSADERLDTWKEIAAYMKRDVRTVQRWEKEQELPVRRHVHNQLPTVYAYPHELDAWWNNRKDRLEMSSEAIWKVGPVRWVAVALIVAAAGSGWYLWNDSPTPPMRFGERDWLLVAPFDNRSGDPVFDGTVKYAFERELANSQFVNVVPRQRVEDALGLMRKPLDTPLDRSLAREVCLRDGAIRVFLTGRVEKLNGNYALWAEVVDPVLDTPIASWSEAWDEKEEFLPVLQRLSRSVRAGLGESIAQIRQIPARLERVTTPSLSALKLFSEGDVLLHRRIHGGAAELFKRALKEDPDFPAAHMWLAYALRNDGHPRAEWLPHVNEAVRLSDHVSEAERLVILAKSHSIQGKDEQAIPLYEALLRIDPDHYWGTNNLIASYNRLGRAEDMLGVQSNMIRLRPRDPRGRFSLAFSLANLRFDFERAAAHREEGLKLFWEQKSGGGWGVAWLELFPAFRNLAEGDPPAAQRAADAVETRLDSFHEPLRSKVASQLGLFHLTFGRAAKTRELADQIQHSHDRMLLQLHAAYMRDDFHELQDLARRLFDGGRRLDVRVAAVLARSGRLSQAEQILQLYETDAPHRFQPYLKGEIAAAQGDFEQASRALRQAVELMKPHNTSALYLAAESLARVYETQGGVSEAVQLLQGLQDSRRLINPWCGPLWLKSRFQLLDLYQAPGFEKEKRNLELQMTELLGRDTVASMQASRLDIVQ